ncbi:MAG: hypothetical protein ABSD46_03015 [Bacteroidota bacterium]
MLASALGLCSLRSRRAVALLCLRGCISTIVFSVSRVSRLGGIGRLLRLGLVSVGSCSAVFAVIGVTMFSSFSSVGFCGSRSLPASAQPLVASVVSSVLSGSSARLVVGCSVGADALVLSSVPQSSLSRVSVFAAFGFSGRGACSLSAVPVVAAAGRGGAFINWWSGGRLSVPLRLRLAKRSLALVQFLARRRSALVCFLSSPSSRGSLLACRVAVRLGIPVFVFCVGFSPSRLPRLGRGSWSLVQVAGSQACQWQSKSLKKQLKEFYESITYSKYDFRRRKHVRRIHEEIKNVFTLGLLLFSIIVVVILSHFVPMKSNQYPQPIPKAERIYTEYQEMLLQFDDENESAKCLHWLNKTPATRLRLTLKKSKIHSNRIDTLLSNRPYHTWTEVLYLPKVGITTIENIITAWRKVK